MPSLGEFGAGPAGFSRSDWKWFCTPSQLRISTSLHVASPAPPPQACRMCMRMPPPLQGPSTPTSAATGRFLLPGPLQRGGGGARGLLSLPASGFQCQTWATGSQSSPKAVSWTTVTPTHPLWQLCWCVNILWEELGRRGGSPPPLEASHTELTPKRGGGRTLHLEQHTNLGQPARVTLVPGRGKRGRRVRGQAGEDPRLPQPVSLLGQHQALC